MMLVKAHAYGNDFLLLETRNAPAGVEPAALARQVCGRQRGVGADGLILYDRRRNRLSASMRLFNADGSRSEISGNGVRCLAAWLTEQQNLTEGTALEIGTDAGVKRLTLLERRRDAMVFRAAMGAPEQLDRRTLQVGGLAVPVVTLRVGNPQCVVLGEVTETRLHTIAAQLAVHPHFPGGTNVELARVEAPDQVRILIWERGVGPTEASGTGACAAAVAAIEYGGALRDLQVASPGGTQRVEWRDDGLYLTGSAQLIAEVRWLR